MMLYYQTKFGCKQTSSLKEIEIVNFDYISPCCDLDIQDSGPVILHDSLACDAA